MGASAESGRPLFLSFCRADGSPGIGMYQRGVTRMPGEWLLLALVTGVVFVNGFTDAPNAVTGVVCAGTLPFGGAVAMAAVCNAAGLLLACRYAPRVSDTVRGMADFSASGEHAAAAALCSALLAVIAFAIAAWVFGIPTSESHALLAALSGAALAGGGRVSPGAWASVALGLAVSSLGGLLAGALLGAAARHLPKGRGMRGVSVVCAAFMALMHGAQDGLKFTAVLTEAFPSGTGRPGGAAGAVGIVLVGSAMALGTLCGGRRIIEAVGEKMVPLDAGSGAASDLAGALLLLAATWTGVPMSTSHTKACAVLGAGAASGAPVDVRVLGGMVFAWAATFPVCGAVGWLFTRLAA